MTPLTLCHQEVFLHSLRSLQKTLHIGMFSVAGGGGKLRDDETNVKSFVVGFPSGILDNESRKRLEPLRGSVRFTPSLYAMVASLPVGTFGSNLELE